MSIGTKWTFFVLDFDGTYDNEHGSNGVQPLVYLTADQRPFKLANKFFQMMLDHPIEVHQFPVDIVNDFGLAGSL